MRLRFSPAEIELLKAAETVQGEALSRTPHALALRDALALMKAGRKVAAGEEGRPVVLAEAEAAALAGATQNALRQLERYHDHLLGWRGREPFESHQVALLERAFPTARGSASETSRLLRGLQALATRLQAPLRPS